jgi:hypothetical protein
MRKPAPEKDIMESKKKELRFSGIIELWVNDKIYAVRQFKGKKNRTSIIQSWLQMLGNPLEPRTIYIILKPMNL